MISWEKNGTWSDLENSCYWWGTYNKKYWGCRSESLSECFFQSKLDPGFNLLHGGWENRGNLIVLTYISVKKAILIISRDLFNATILQFSKILREFWGGIYASIVLWTTSFIEHFKFYSYFSPSTICNTTKKK